MGMKFSKVLIVRKLFPALFVSAWISALWATAAFGGTMPNLSKVWTVWNGRNVDWSKAANDEYPLGFVRYVELMAATGGNPERDCFKDPSDRMTLDDYDFSALVKMCRSILGCGMKPYLKLGGVPSKFTDDYDGGSFRTNIRPPSDPKTHYRYLRACAAALKNEFGLEEVRSWRFAVLTEADNYAWFRVGDKDAAATREAFFSLYDHAVKAFEDELGSGIIIGTHLLDPHDCQFLGHSFSAAELARHCRDGVNYASGGKGSPLRLLTFSHYHIACGDKDAGSMKSIAAELAEVRALGFTNLVTGVDEGRIIYGTPGALKRDLLSRAVGESYQAAYDVRFAKAALDLGMDYLSTWGWFSGPSATAGVPSHHYFAQRELAKFAGYTRLDDGTDADLVAGFSPDGKTIRAAVAAFTDRLDCTNRVIRRVALKLPQSFADKRVEVTTLMLDDRNNWFVEWTADRKRFGVRDEDFGWSPDDFLVLAGRVLKTPEHRRLFERELQPRYAEIVRKVQPAKTFAEVAADGTLMLTSEFLGNGAAFFMIKPQAGRIPPESVSLRTLLTEMADPDAVTYLDEPEWTGRQWSSYDRRSLPDASRDADGWFANNDRSQFLYVENRGGHHEWVMVDAKGPGALTRLWCANCRGAKIRFYLDGGDKPLYEGVVTNLIGGGVIAPRPFTQEDSPLQPPYARSQNLYLPIPYAKSLKVTCELDPADGRFWYNAETRTYPVCTEVVSFAKDQVADLPRTFDPPCEYAPLKRRYEGQAAIRGLRIPPGRRVRIAFDGVRTVDCRSELLCGADWTFVMPFERSCEIEMDDFTDASAAVGAYEWRPGRSMHFHARDLRFTNMPSRKNGGPYELTWLDVKGRGRLVGNALIVDNNLEDPSKSPWWGEGDEKIYVDGESFPSYFGTGTEDFFGYSWGPGEAFTDHPFLALPLSDAHRASETAPRRAAAYRRRRLDSIPFTRSLKLDVEVWHWSDCHLDYSPASFWYQLR